MSLLTKALMPFAALLVAVWALRTAFDLLKPMLPWLCPLAVVGVVAGLYVAWRRCSW
jgi:hypothetical protein